MAKVKVILKVGVLMDIEEAPKNNNEWCDFFSNTTIKEIWDESEECLIMNWKKCSKKPYSSITSNDCVECKDKCFK